MDEKLDNLEKEREELAKVRMKLAGKNNLKGIQNILMKY